MGYDRHCRSLDPVDAERRAASGEPAVVRLKMPLDGTTRFHDQLRGELEFDNARIDDQVLLKSDGFPTYHLANVVDDRLMGISHVIRAEEWISSTPKHVALYAAFGWPEPQWIHMPLLRNADHSKISKRKNPTSLAYYRRAGVLPHALVNFLGLMGWSFGNDREIFTLPEMIGVFDIKSVSLGGPVFDQEKLTWLNQHYMHQMTDEQFASHLRAEVFSDAFLRQLKPLALERMSRFEQFVDNNAFFFNGALRYDGVSLVPQGKTPEDVRAMFEGLVERLDDLYEWHAPKIKELMDAYRAAVGWKPKDFFMTVRLVVTGRADSPPLVETMEILGREMVRYRIRHAATSAIR
jgi:glutamyl-tRNA synthetase